MSYRDFTTILGTVKKFVFAVALFERVAFIILDRGAIAPFDRYIPGYATARAHNRILHSYRVTCLVLENCNDLRLVYDHSCLPAA